MPDIAALIAQLAEADAAKVKDARQQLQALADQAKDEAARHSIADALGAALIARAANGEYAHPQQVRVWLCEHLTTLATRKQLPALLTALREDIEVREAVCRVLGTFASPIATDELTARLKKETDPALRIAILDALVVQRWRETISVVRGVARKDPDIEVRLRALEVLATFPVGDSDNVYTDALAALPPAPHPRVHRARARFCETLLQYGEYIAAQSVSQSILASAAPAPQKEAAQLMMERAKSKLMPP